jgi:hypothetical protein
MLKNYAFPQIHDDNKLVPQLEGASVHFAYNVWDCLNANFSGRWAGRIGRIVCPPPLFFWSYNFGLFFLSGYVKVQVYSQRVNTLDELESTVHCRNCKGYKGYVTARMAGDELWVETKQSYRWRSLWSVPELTVFPFESKNAAYNTFVSLSVHRNPDISFGRSSISQTAWSVWSAGKTS